MAMPDNQAQMETFIQTSMMEFLAQTADSVYGMLHPRFVRCDYAARTLAVVLEVQPWMRNGNGVMHGGAIAAALDTVSGILARCYVPSGKIAPTTNLTVAYHAPIPLGEHLTLHARVAHVGRRLIHISSEACVNGDGGERVMATAACTHFVTD